METLKSGHYERRSKYSRGFTLIDILLVVIIIGILVSLVAPRLAGRSEEARKQAAHADIEGGISLALDLYEVDNGRYPNSLDDLITKPSDAPSWKGPYIKKGLPKDPWGSPYIYKMPGVHNAASYDLYSLGMDKQESTQDDIVNWKTEAAY